MSDKTLLAVGMLGTLMAICGVLVLWRLRAWSARRVEAEQRAVLAFEEMNRVTRSLRTEAPAEDSTLPPGERLRRRYPGVSRAGVEQA